jgi:TatA/E family protein of Tat protein translocase
MGLTELIVILIVVLLFFGAGRLPAIGEGLGKAIRGLRDSIRSEPPRPPPPPEPPAPPAPAKELPPGDRAGR